MPCIRTLSVYVLMRFQLRVGGSFGSKIHMHEYKYFLDYAKHFTVNRHVFPSDNSDKSQ